MSWRPSGDSRSSAPSPLASGPDGGPPVLDPALQGLIIAAFVVGLVGLGLMAAFGGALGTAQTGTAPTSAAAGAPTSAAAAAPTTAAAAPTAAGAAAPTAAAAGVVTAPFGSALATGTGTPLSLSTDPAQLVFSQPALTVKSGLVNLTYTNGATAVQHNLVLVNGDTTVAEAVNTAAAAQVTRQTGGAGSVPPATTPNLLFGMQMLNPGEKATITFQTPPPGTYTFFCTFPGHFIAGMEGKLTVTP